MIKRGKMGGFLERNFFCVIRLLKLWRLQLLCTQFGMLSATSPDFWIELLVSIECNYLFKQVCAFLSLAQKVLSPSMTPTVFAYSSEGGRVLYLVFLTFSIDYNHSYIIRNNICQLSLLKLSACNVQSSSIKRCCNNEQ